MNILVLYQLADQSLDINTAGVCSTTSSTALPVVGCYLMRSSEDIYQVSLILTEVDYVSTLQQKHTQNMPKAFKLLPKKRNLSMKLYITYFIKYHHTYKLDVKFVGHGSSMARK